MRCFVESILDYLINAMPTHFIIEWSLQFIFGDLLLCLLMWFQVKLKIWEVLLIVKPRVKPRVKPCWKTSSQEQTVRIVQLFIQMWIRGLGFAFKVFQKWNHPILEDTVANYISSKNKYGWFSTSFLNVIATRVKNISHIFRTKSKAVYHMYLFSDMWQARV